MVFLIKTTAVFVCLLLASPSFAGWPPLFIEEQDGSPTGVAYKLKVSNGTLTKSGVIFTMDNITVGSPVASGTNDSVLYIDSSGNLATNSPGLIYDGTDLGLGEASPTSRIHVTGGTNGTSNWISIFNNNGNEVHKWYVDGVNDGIWDMLADAGTVSMRFDASDDGTIVVGNTVATSARPAIVARKTTTASGTNAHAFVDESDYDLEEIGDVTFTGSGLDDLTSGGAVTISADTDYIIRIDATAGSPDTFEWDDDGELTIDQNATGVAITGAAQTLSYGVTVTFGAIDGHTVADLWEFEAARRSCNSFDAISETIGSDNYDHILGFQARNQHDSSGTLEALGGFSSMLVNDGGAVTNAINYKVNNLNGTNGSCVNQYGFYVDDDLTEGTSSNIAFYNAGTADSVFMGDVGVGTVTPSGRLHVKGPDFPLADFERVVANTTNGWVMNRFNATTTGGAAGNNFGPVLVFSITDNAVTNQQLAQIQISKGTNIDDGSLRIRTSDGGTMRTGIFINSSQETGLGTTSPGNRLHVVAAENDIARFESDQVDYSRIIIDGDQGEDAQISFQRSTSSKWSFGNDAGTDSFLWRTGVGAFGTNDKMALTSTGNLGLALVDPDEVLEAFGNIRTSTDTARYYAGTDKDSYWEFDGDSMNIVATAVTGTDDMNLIADTVVLGTSTTNNVVVSSAGVMTFVGDSGLLYGSCYGNHIGWSSATATQNAWINISTISMNDGGGGLNGITHDGSGKLTVTEPGRYMVNYSICFQDNAANDHIEAGIEVSGSGSAVGDGQAHLENKFANEEEHMSSALILNLVDNATVEVAIRTTDAGTPTINVQAVNVVMTMIGG